MKEICRKVALRVLPTVISLCVAGCASPWYSREECLEILKARGVDLDLSEPQIVAEKMRNPMSLVGTWSGEFDVSMTSVEPYLKEKISESQIRFAHVYDFRADGTYAQIIMAPNDDAVNNALRQSQSRVFGTWTMDGDVLVLRETHLNGGKVLYRNLEKRLTVLQYGYDEIGIQFASRRDMEASSETASRQSIFNSQHSWPFGTPSREVGYDRQNREVSCTFTPYKDNKGSMAVIVGSNSRYKRTSRPSGRLAAVVPPTTPTSSSTHSHVAGTTLSRPIPANAPSKYVLERFAWNREGDWRCGFEYKITGECTLGTISEIERKVCAYIRKSYLSAHPMADAQSVEVDARLSFVDGRVVGTGMVLAITPVSLTYDAIARHGIVSVRFDPQQYEMARVWVRRNIETLARDKNILLKTGEMPPPGRYITGDERIVDTADGKVLEMEFKTE